MKLLINPNGEQPIYEQIKLQIKEQIIGGSLPAGTMLPSIRMLAKELKIGIITAKRAYDDLTAEGFTESVAGKGVFVAQTDRQTLTDRGKEQLKKYVSEAVTYSRANGIDKKSFMEIAESVWEDK